MKRIFYLYTVLIIMSVTLFGGQFAGSEDLRVSCPSIEQESRRRTNHPHEPERPIELVVLGKVRRLSKDNRAGDTVYEVTVEKVLYGGIKGRTVKINYPWTVPDEDSSIFALVPSIYDYESGASYEVKYYLPAKEESSQRALSAARFDFNVLSSESIFVGKEVKTGDDFEHEVEVQRVLYGSVPKDDENVTIYVGGYIQHSGKIPKVRSDSEIYFISAIQENRRTKKTNYVLNCRIDASKEADVVTALKRRTSYPIVDYETPEGPGKCIEIMFSSTAGEAIDLMGSESDAAVTLGARYLLYNKDKVKEEVVAAVREDLFRMPEKGGQDFCRLKNLIPLLSMMEEGKPDGAIGKLTSEYISHISKSTVQPPKPERDNRSNYYEREEDRVDSNHALAWLLTSMEQEDVLNHFVKDLLKLKASVKGQWLEEVQLALDAARVEDGLELNAALARMKNIKPVRSTASRIFHQCNQVAFSPDGKFLATAGNEGEIKIWQTEDWSLSTTIKQEGIIDRIIFSPDNSYLYVSGRSAVCIHSRFDLKTGEKDKDYKIHNESVTYIWLSKDGKRMITGSFYEDILKVYNVETDIVEKSCNLVDGSIVMAVSPDGKLVASPHGENTVNITDISTGERIHSLIHKNNVNELVFNSDGNFLAIAFSDSPVFDQSTVMLLDVKAGYRVVGKYSAHHRFTHSMAFSPSSDYLILGLRKACLQVLSTPELRLVKEIRWSDPKEVYSVESIDYSPDGKVFAVGAGYTKPHIIDASSFEEVNLDTGHSEAVESVFFMKEDRIRSIAKDNTVCIWDASTMRLLSKLTLPMNTTFVGASPPDGKFALCASSAKLDTPFWSPDSSVPPVKVFDTDSGKVVSEVDLPVNWSFTATRLKWLSNGQAVLLADGTWYYFDYIKGKMIEKHGLNIDKQNGLFNGLGYPTEDSKSLFLILGGGRSSGLEIEIADIASGKSKVIGHIELPRFTGNDSGLVPDGKHFYIGDPGLFIYDRKTLKLVARKDFKNLDLLQIVFSPDGSRYAVVTGGRIFIDSDFSKWDPNTQSIVRVHETLSGNTLFAFPSTTRWVRDIKFSPDGNRLTLAEEDGTLEVWSFPK